MAAAVLLKKNAAPSDAEIEAAITNICRCGIYPRLAAAIQRAGRVLSGDETINAGARPGIDPAEAARSVPALTPPRSEEHTSELQSPMRISYAVFCLKKKKKAST